MIYRVEGSDWNHWGVSAHVGTWYFNSVLRSLEFTNMFRGVCWHITVVK